MDFGTRETVELEAMDDPDCDLRRLTRTYEQFRLVNALVSRWRAIYRTRIRPRLERGRENTLLDIGFGGGDVPRALAGWARRDGFALRITAIDPDPRAQAFVAAQPATLGVEFRPVLSSEVEGSFDIVTSNHVLHHLAAPELAALLADSERLGRYSVHNDLHRSRLAYGVYAVATRPAHGGSLIHEDGLLSIRRSYTAGELRAVAPSGWRVERVRPYRLLLTHECAA
ncbi:methyltransferase domain-containing protein [Microbacteriaceae bacterium VKM Ac-2855]|nr:methyltransferase domain-containing protein [Microbacteriaceae bacterium VKM Ac-2855]